MTVPTIGQSDLDRLAGLFPDLNLNDCERQAVLTENGAKDIQAAPGSGKTTLLAVKLLLLAQRWPHARRGICVLSHTNVARDQIAARLSGTPDGAVLLGYPHFVGTIHAFVNQYLALPLLRSDGEVVDVIDNDVFAARACALLRTKPILNAWVSRNEHQGPSAIRTLRYEGPDLTLGWEEGGLPGEDTESYKQALQLKNTLRTRGIFRHDDMFAFGERLLKRCPELSQRLSWRFPMVLIDEMQDTSWEQEQMLERVFDANVVVQRYGDRNQRILVSAKDSAKLSFPKAGFLSVSSTKRFPEPIAAAVRAVQEHGEPVVARADVATEKPWLILYETAAVTSVIEEFGRRLLESLPDDILGSGAIKAVCARKQASAKAEAGRHLVDYWPAYRSGAQTAKGEWSAYALLSDHPEMGVSSFDLSGRVRDVKRVVLLALRDGGCRAVDGIRDASALIRQIERAGVDATPLRRLCWELAVRRGHTSDVATWTATLDRLHEGLKHLLPTGLTRSEFGSMDLFALPETPEGPMPAPNESVICRDGRSVRVQIGTVASVKGETHLATLVLEAHGGRAKCFDLERAIGDISGTTSLKTGLSNTVLGLYHNLYVAMSRPSRVLCLAMNKKRADGKAVEALANSGWIVSELSG